MVGRRNAGSKRGQMTIEYTVMFVAICAAIIWGSLHYIQPSMNRFFRASGNLIDEAVACIEDRF